MHNIKAQDNRLSLQCKEVNPIEARTISSFCYLYAASEGSFSFYGAY